MVVNSSNLGYPRIGPNRELKRVVESYLNHLVNKDELESEVLNIKKTIYLSQKDLDIVPCNDFSLYDHVLDTYCELCSKPTRFEVCGNDLDCYFAMARGLQNDTVDVKPLKMLKWFDTNYHYIQPEINKDTLFRYNKFKVLDEFLFAKQHHNNPRPVIIGPVSFVLLSAISSDLSIDSVVTNLLPSYKEMLEDLLHYGMLLIQIDEPFLSHDLSNEIKSIYLDVYNQIGSWFSNQLEIMITSYFAPYDDNIDLLLKLKSQVVHFDLVHGVNDLTMITHLIDVGKINHKKISFGIVDGRNIWINDVYNSFNKINDIVKKIGVDKAIVAPSCSMIHCPIDKDLESGSFEVLNYLAFANQKIKEINIIRDLLNGNINYDDPVIVDIAKRFNDKSKSNLVHVNSVQDRVSSIVESDVKRSVNYQERIELQANKFNFPIFPMTTIGSFPQTSDVRKVRAKLKSGKMSIKEYNDFIKNEIYNCIKFQENVGEVGLDVLVHGEFERSDMVEYFSQKMSGFLSTSNGWVQSYGTRCVKPPIIYGDVYRVEPITVEWTSFAQKQTNRDVKGILTGPVTMLKWSFVRDDQPLESTCRQIALAILDEVLDLEESGVHIIQIDEPALREAMPIRKIDHDNYLNWAIKCFRLASSKVQSTTQIHTHMCYSDFRNLIQYILLMDVDVISIEAARSVDLLSIFTDYQNQIGPGVYDIHSPRIPSVDEIYSFMLKVLQYIPKERLWINPDCGLKTRQWDEVRRSLNNIVKATLRLRDFIDHEDE